MKELDCDAVGPSEEAVEEEELANDFDDEKDSSRLLHVRRFTVGSYINLM